MMEDYFASIADDISNGGDNVRNIDQHESIQAIANHNKTNCDHQTFHFNEIKVSDVAKILRETYTTKASGWDTIPPRVFKIGFAELAVLLCYLYNHCISNSY